jgi:hypothetical protein
MQASRKSCKESATNLSDPFPIPGRRMNASLGFAGQRFGHAVALGLISVHVVFADRGSRRISLTPISGPCDVVSLRREWSNRSADTPVEARAEMKWFRSNIRLGSRLALFALAIQFLLSFGHFHGGNAEAAPAPVRASQSHHSVSLAAAGFAAAHRDALTKASQARASRLSRLKTSSGHEPAGQPADDCAICAVMALANAMVVATPPGLLGPPTAQYTYSTAEAGFVHLNSACVGFQPRAPPVS